MENARPHNTAESSALDRVNFTASPRFMGTDNPRHLRVIFALLRRPRSRKELDSIAGCANGPELVAELRRRGLTGDKHLPCERIRFIDRDGKVCRPGVYSFTSHGRRLIYAWLVKRRGAAHG
jgi:hypothetical protein